MEEGTLECQYGKCLLDTNRQDQLLFDLKEKFSTKSIINAKKRESRIYDSDHNYIAYLKYSGLYTIVWIKLLDYFELSHYKDYYEFDNWGIG